MSSLLTTGSSIFSLWFFCSLRLESSSHLLTLSKFLSVLTSPKMLKSASGALAHVLKRSLIPAARATAAVQIRKSHGGPVESDEEFDSRYEAYLNRPDIDGWEIRKAMNDLCGMDLVPDPKIIRAALYACRRVNDYALAVRIIEACKDKCGPKVNEIYPYIIQEIKPTLTELGIETPEELGYDKPELAVESVDEM